MDIFLSKENKISVANELIDDGILRKFKMIEFVRDGSIVFTRFWDSITSNSSDRQWKVS